MCCLSKLGLYSHICFGWQRVAGIMFSFPDYSGRDESIENLPGVLLCLFFVENI